MTEIHAFDPDGTPSPGAQAGMAAHFAASLPVVNVMDHGAKGDGTTDDYAAIMDAIGDGGVHVVFPAGTFMHSQSITVPSNTEISGAGRGLTVIKLTTDCPPESWGFVNRDRDAGNENISIRDLRVDGNVPARFGDDRAQAGGGSRGSGITFGNVTRGWITRVDSVDNVLHGFDVTCASVGYPYNGDMPVSDAVGPSRYVWIDSCYASGFGDDGFTTHHSEFLWISNSHAENPRNRDNCNGIEVDDGSRHVFLTNNSTTGCFGGIEIKAHADAPAGQDVHISGHLSLNDVRSYNWRHIGHHSGDDPDSLSAYDIQASDLVSITPNNSKGFQGGSSPKALSISAFRRVRIRGFTALGDGSGDVSPVNIQYRASDVRISDMILRDFGPSDSGVYVSSSSEGVVLDGLTVINTGLRAVQVAGAGAVTLRVSSARLVAPPGGGDYGIDAGYIEAPSAFSISDDCHAEGYTTPVRVHGSDFMSARDAGHSMWLADPSATELSSLTAAGIWYLRAGDFSAKTDRPADAPSSPFVLENRPDRAGSGVLQTLSRWSTGEQMIYTRTVAGSGVSAWAKFTTTEPGAPVGD